jgi:hypothetical protein
MCRGCFMSDPMTHRKALSTARSGMVLFALMTMGFLAIPISAVFFAWDVPLIVIPAVIIGLLMSLFPGFLFWEWKRAHRRLKEHALPWSAVGMLAVQLESLPRVTVEGTQNARRVKGYSTDVFAPPRWMAWCFGFPIYTILGVCILLFLVEKFLGGVSIHLFVAVFVASTIVSFFLVKRSRGGKRKSRYRVICWMDNDCLAGRLLDPSDLPPGTPPPVLSLGRRRYDCELEMPVGGGKVDTRPVESWPIQMGHEFSIRLVELDAPAIHLPMQFDLWTLEVERQLEGKPVRDSIALHPPAHPLVGSLYRPSRWAD